MPCLCITTDLWVGLQLSNKTIIKLLNVQEGILLWRQPGAPGRVVDKVKGCMLGMLWLFLALHRPPFEKIHHVSLLRKGWKSWGIFWGLPVLFWGLDALIAQQEDNPLDVQLLQKNQERPSWPFIPPKFPMICPRIKTESIMCSDGLTVERSVFREVVLMQLRHTKGNREISSNSHLFLFGK